MLPTPEIIEARKKAAALINNCLFGGMIVREVLKEWPANYDDITLLCARHAIIHYEADEEIRMRDRAFADQQIEWLETIIDILSKGEALPHNIIQSYEEYYYMPISIKARIVNWIMFIILKVKLFFSKK